MPRIRTALAAVSSLALAGLLAGPAHAVPRQDRASDQVNTFFGQYRAAVRGQNPGTDTAGVRAKFLTAQLDTDLDQWAVTHNADPVFRAQNVPNGWSVRYNGSGAGHSTVILTERFGDGRSIDVWYQVRLADLAIDGLEDPPS
ncbi:hypothetical protein OG455_30945 [Kitasatospora sp. NBC_01287]|uniref:hypothetical protein n=1 Tax=Kitasatospora sp. NBC_01287 TaxID=2903573 RepID=UPI00225B46EC|nr:hypothetical protein [Kitasatospora sp. NBC_01287]MCX4749882.1 hypothetical protein [Kitasatospora sp. NBC_01287]